MNLKLFKYSEHILMKVMTFADNDIDNLDKTCTTSPNYVTTLKLIVFFVSNVDKNAQFVSYHIDRGLIFNISKLVFLKL